VAYSVKLLQETNSPLSIPAATPEKEVAAAADQAGEGSTDDVHAGILEKLIKTNLW
jgi:hypothetical protein